MNNKLGRTSFVAIALALAVAGCGGESETPAPAPPSGAVPSAPTPPSPPPPPPSAQNFVGAIYVGANNPGPGGNFVVAFGRTASGALVPIDAFATGGVGRGAFRNAGDPPRLNPLISEDSLLPVDDRYLLVVNAGSNTVTSFAIEPGFGLRIVDQQPSGGVMPVSLARRDGIVYVANADADGAFAGPADQSGNVTAFRIDLSTGRLIPIGGSARALGVRPSDVEFSADGRHLLVSASNAGSASLASRSTAEILSFGVAPDGSLTASPQATSASTLPGNPDGRNLPTAIGMETFSLGGRQFVVVAEAREYLPDGRPGTLAEAQTGSVSSWEIAADGELFARSVDVLAGPTRTSGPTGTGWITLAPMSRYFGSDIFSVSSSTGARISAFMPGTDGTVVRLQQFAGGGAVNPGAADPFDRADGFLDLVVTIDGPEPTVYLLLGLKGGVARFGLDTLVASNIALRDITTSGLLPQDNIQGIAAVSARR